jgi:hypothetical protein
MRAQGEREAVIEFLEQMAPIASRFALSLYRSPRENPPALTRGEL